MNTDAICERILGDARAEAARIIRDADARVEAVRAESALRIAAWRAENEQQIQQGVERQWEQMLREAEMEQRRLVISAKREVLDQVFDAVLGAMRTMPEAQRDAYNERLLIEAALGGERIICADENAGQFSAGFFAKINSALAETGRNPVSLATERRAIGGGFLLASDGVLTDCSDAAVLEVAWMDIEGDIARMLFEE